MLLPLLLRDFERPLTKANPANFCVLVSGWLTERLYRIFKGSFDSSLDLVPVKARMILPTRNTRGFEKLRVWLVTLESEGTEAVRVRECERESTCKRADGDGDVSGAVYVVNRNVDDVCGMIPLTTRGASGALYTQNSGVIFIHNTPGTVFFFK